jgi:hypothetical protein
MVGEGEVLHVDGRGGDDHDGSDVGLVDVCGPRRRALRACDGAWNGALSATGGGTGGCIEVGLVSCARTVLMGRLVMTGCVGKGFLVRGGLVCMRSRRQRRRPAAGGGGPGGVIIVGWFGDDGHWWRW